MPSSTLPCRSPAGRFCGGGIPMSDRVEVNTTRVAQG
jgi:hypothetical protein